jgi:hypothetical protein
MDVKSKIAKKHTNALDLVIKHVQIEPQKVTVKKVVKR